MYSAETGAAAGSFVDNGYRGHYEFSHDDEYRISFGGGQWTEYVFAGPSMAATLERYTWLTGRAELPPVWALGYHQCRWHVYSQADVERIAKRYRADEFPCDAMWLDIDYMDGYRVFTWDKRRFPRPAHLIADLKQQGLQSVTIVDPGVKVDPDYEVYQQGQAGGHFLQHPDGREYNGSVWPGRSAFPDFHQPEARAWWGEHVRRWQAGAVAKCDFCSRRVDQGLPPACVAACPTEARIFGDLDDPDSAPSTLVRERNGKPPLPEKNTRPKVFYVD